MFKPRVIPAIALVTLSLASACVEPTDDAATADAAFVFGLSADEVMMAKRVAVTDLTDAAWLDAHRGDFDCGRYGDLCAMLGRAQAAEVIELGYRLALDGAGRAAVVAAQQQAIADAPPPPPSTMNHHAHNSAWFYGGSTNKRIKVIAYASTLWPSLDLEARGKCIYEKQVLLWTAASADRISGSVLGTWDETFNAVDAGAVTGASTLQVGPRTHGASHLKSRMSCQASDDLWSTMGSVTVEI